MVEGKQAQQGKKHGFRNYPFGAVSVAVCST